MTATLQYGLIFLGWAFLIVVGVMYGLGLI